MRSENPDGVVRPQGAIEKVSFEGDDLDVVRDERGVWVSTRRVCDALGVSFDAQRVKLAKRSWAVVTQIVMTGSDGKRYEMHCVALERLSMWLGTIDENRVAEHVRPKLVKYQAECAGALHRHFFGERKAESAMPVELVGTYCRASAVLHDLSKTEDDAAQRTLLREKAKRYMLALPDRFELSASRPRARNDQQLDLDFPGAA